MADYAAIDSLEAAKALTREGLLAPMLLFPPELGGEAIAENTVFVPQAIVDQKHETTVTLVGLVRAGVINQLTVTPEYRGDSCVPAKIAVRAWFEGRPGDIEYAIEIW